MGHDWAAQPTLLVSAQTTWKKKNTHTTNVGPSITHTSRGGASGTHLCVAAADAGAGVAVVVVVQLLVHPLPNGPRGVERRRRGARPEVFTHGGELGGRASGAFQIGVVFERAFSGPLPCDRS